MSASNVISCKQFADFLVSQEPVYDKEIIKDIRPTDGGLIGYYQTGTFDAFSGVQHTVDRFNATFPNVTHPWGATTGGSGVNCSGSPCDPTENKIGWGSTRYTYALEEQSWGTGILCFDQIMTKTKAKEHFRQIIDDVLRPATNWIMTYYLQRKALELAESKICVCAGLPAFTFTWDDGGYVYLNTTQTPTGRLTPDILRSRVRRQYFLGAVQAGKEGFDKLELHTDMDTFHYLCKEDTTLKSAWRFGEFGPAAKEFYKYGLSGYVGDFVVKCLQFPLRFNKVSAGRFQLVLPYKNVAATEGIKSVYNDDYDKAQYQISYINNSRGLRVLPFRPEAVNPQMPYAIRDYGGKWSFATNDLGADCNGKPVDNTRKNKGRFIADFRLATKPEHAEWIEVFFHVVDRPAIAIVGATNSDPGYPAQSYTSVNTTCPVIIVLETATKNDGSYAIAQNSIQVNGNALQNSAVSGATHARCATCQQKKSTAGSARARSGAAQTAQRVCASHARAAWSDAR